MDKILHLRDPGRTIPCEYQETMVSHGFRVVQDFVHPQYRCIYMYSMCVYAEVGEESKKNYFAVGSPYSNTYSSHRLRESVLWFGKPKEEETGSPETSRVMMETRTNQAAKPRIRDMGILTAFFWGKTAQRNFQGMLTGQIPVELNDHRMLVDRSPCFCFSFLWGSLFLSPKSSSDRQLHAMGAELTPRWVTK